MTAGGLSKVVCVCVGGGGGGGGGGEGPKKSYKESEYLHKLCSTCLEYNSVSHHRSLSHHWPLSHHRPLIYLFLIALHN